LGNQVSVHPEESDDIVFRVTGVFVDAQVVDEKNPIVVLGDHRMEFSPGFILVNEFSRHQGIMHSINPFSINQDSRVRETSPLSAALATRAGGFRLRRTYKPNLSHRRSWWSRCFLRRGLALDDRHRHGSLLSVELFPRQLQYRPRRLFFIIGTTSSAKAAW